MLCLFSSLIPLSKCLSVFSICWFSIQLPPYLFSFLAKTFPEYREKKCFADHQTSNAVQLIAVIKENFPGLFFTDQVKK